MAKKKDINAKVSNNAGYQGNVTLRIKQGDRIVKTINTHNAGTQYFFYGIAYAISGEIQGSYLPKYISAGTGTYSGSEEYALTGLVSELSDLSGSRPLLVKNYKSPQYDGNGGVSVTYQGLLPSSLIGASSVQELGLFGTVDSASLLARIQLDSPLQLDPGQSLIVEWKFTISNQA